MTDITSLVINNLTPPAWNNSYDEETPSNSSWRRELVFMDCNLTNLYVPDASLDDYVNDTYWGGLTSDKGVAIKPLSQMAKVATRALWDVLPAADQAVTLIEEYM